MIVELLTVPAVVLVVGAFVLPLLPEKVRGSAFLVFPLIALGLIWSFPEGHLLTGHIASYELHLVSVDALSRIFGTIFSLIAIIGGIYAFHIKDLGQQSNAMMYAAGALGVTFAGDYFTLFFFWELMAFASAYLIWARRTDTSSNAGMRYLIFHSLGGGLFLSGILMHLSSGGSLVIGTLDEVFTTSNVFILLAVAINTAIPPLHAWLADAYPKATVTGAVFMSALTTKSAVYVLIRLFAGWDILIWVGVIMSLYGVVYAVLVNDIREILAYHIISQVGYMVAGVGIGTEMSINGTTAHAFSHILYKSLLFMGAGAVIYSTGKSKLTELGGFAKKMPWVVGLYMIGAFSISGFPLFNGFISKSMVISAAGEAHLEWVNLLLLLASVGTFLHTGLKLPYFTWFGEAKSKITVSAIPKNMLFAMGVGAFLCTLFGVAPSLLYNYLPYPVDYQPYNLYHLVETTQILIFTFIGFWLLRKKLEGAPKIALDTDWFYRKPADTVRLVFVNLPNRLFGNAENLVLALAGKVTEFSKNPMSYLNPTSPNPDHPVETDDFTVPLQAALGVILLCVIVIGLVILL